MFLIVTRTFPPEVGGMQNLIWGLAKSLSDRVSVYAEANYFATDGWTAGSGDTAIKWEGVSAIGYKAGFRYKL